MLVKSVVILCLILSANAGAIKERNIPVEVRYDEDNNSLRNLDETVQLPADQLKEIVVEESVKPDEDNLIEKSVSGAKNLDAKVQLTQEELSQAIKYISPQPEVLNDNIAEEDLTFVKKVPVPVEQITQDPQTPLNLQGILNEAQEIIENSLKKLKVSFKPEDDQQAPNPMQWLDFERAVNKFLEEQRNEIQIKQNQPGQNQNIFQNIANGFQTIANNFVQGFNQNNQLNTTNKEDEQQGGTQGPFQGFVSYFQGGVNNIVNSINNLGNQGATTSNTVLGDTGTGTTQAPGFIQGFVNNVQQFFGSIQGGSNQGGGSTGTQSADTAVNSTTTNQQQGPVQVIQSIGSAVTSFFQGGNRPPNTSGDEGTTPSSTNVIQSIGQNIGNAIQNSPFNPFRPQTPTGQESGSTQNPIQAGVQNVGNQIQQLIPGNFTQKNPDDKPSNEQNASVQKPPSVGDASKPQDELIKEQVSQEQNKEVAEVNEEAPNEDKKEEILTAAE